MTRLAAVVLMLSCIAACSSQESGEGGTTLTVFAAASLEDTFTQIGEDFEAANPGVTVTFSFAGSSDLVAQLQQGAPADVLATADERTMELAVDDDLVEVLDTVGTNTMQIVTPADNPGRVDGLDDLADPDLQVVLCAPAVPCGAAAQRIENMAGVDISPASEEQSVTDVLNKVATGEADAGLVYVTDVRAAGDSVIGIDLPTSARVVNTYPIATLSRSSRDVTAQSFVDFVTTGPGHAVIRAAGFGPR